MQQSITFPSGTVQYHFLSAGESPLDAAGYLDNAVLITDEHVAALYPQLFAGHRCIVLPAGEQSKDMATIERCTQQLLQLQATRHTLLVGIGGGVITDITGFLASVYMRGIRFGFMPTTLLGMADAAIGGKNGVNVGLNKNMLGTVKQPEFIIFDPLFLNSLPAAEWSNGFAEIIKYACIFDAPLFAELAAHDLDLYRNDREALSALVARCVAWKNKTVLEDEREQGIRKLLNFGHTAGHAIENMYALPHGQAVGIGMIIACMLSEQVAGLDSRVTAQLKELLARYGLPVQQRIDTGRAMDILKMDKKRHDGTIDYIILTAPGRAEIKLLPLQVIEQAIAAYESSNRAGHH